MITDYYKWRFELGLLWKCPRVVALNIKQSFVTYRRGISYWS
jgi:hypothetical protein